jgi:hypothetical protein
VRDDGGDTQTSDTGKCLVQSSQEGSGVMLDLSEPILRYCTKDDIIDTLLVPPKALCLTLAGQ